MDELTTVGGYVYKGTAEFRPEFAIMKLGAEPGFAPRPKGEQEVVWVPWARVAEVRRWV